jgi:hypothetical protein
MSTDADRLTPATSEDLANALAFALLYRGRKRFHGAGEIMAEIVAERLVEHLERSGFVVMKKPPALGAAALGRGMTGGDVGITSRRCWTSKRRGCWRRWPGSN